MVSELFEPLRHGDLLAGLFPVAHQRQRETFEFAARGRQLRPRFRAQEQRLAKLILKPLDAQADRRLGHEKPL